MLNDTEDFAVLHDEANSSSAPYIKLNPENTSLISM